LPTASPPTLPTGDYALVALLLLFAAGCASTAARLLYDKSFTLGISAIIVAILFFVAALNLPSSYLFSGSLISVAVLVFFLTIISWNEIKLRAFNSRYRTFAAIFIFPSFATYSITYMNALRSDIDTYVIPRTITQKQADDLREYLSHHDKYAVTVKVNPLDAEAREYAAQLFGALYRTNWEAKFNTSSDEPWTLNDGLCIQVMGENANPYDAKHDPKALLQAAFTASDINANCGGGAAAGDYKLFVLVGHRPLSLGYKGPPLVRLGRWIMSLSH
jgi:hypothetical protein